MSQHSTAPFDVRSENRDGMIIAFVSGEADVFNSEKLEAVLTPFIAKRPRRLILELSQLTMISSLAMGKLVAARKSMALHGGEVVLVSPIVMVHDALRRARLTDIFKMTASLDEALA